MVSRKDKAARRAIARAVTLVTAARSTPDHKDTGTDVMVMMDELLRDASRQELYEVIMALARLGSTLDPKYTQALAIGLAKQGD